MSSRAVRKAVGHTAENDLAEVLRKVGLEKKSDLDEDEAISSTTNDRRRNVFQLLLDDDHSNDEKSTVDQDDENLPEDPQPSTTSKTKRKRKGKKKGTTTEKTDQIDDDELLKPSNDVRTDAIPVTPVRDSISELLSVDNRFLNPTNEMKKKFGSAIVEQIERENNPNLQLSQMNLSANRRRALLVAQQQQRPSTRIAKQNTLIFPKLGWPMYYKYGLTMKPSSPLSETHVSAGNYFQFEFDKDYQRLELQYLDFVDQHDLQGIMDILRQYPYHVHALMHLSDLSRMQDDTPTAVDLIERALYSFQQSFHPLFSITRGECRLEYRQEENRAFFISLFKNIIYIGERGCYRTALEFCKVLLSLNPNEDPLAILLLLDFYAIRAEEYQYFIRFHSEQNQRLNLDGLPNFVYSVALAHFRLSSLDEANRILQDALLRFPTVLKYLLEKLSVRPDRNVERSTFFSNSERTESNALKCVQQLFCARMANEWKERDELEFLRLNVNQVIDLVEKNQDPRIQQYRTLRETTYRKTPVNICRHIVLSESNEIRGFLPNDLENGQTFYSFDPFPPRDSIVGFQRPERPTLHINSSYNRWGMLMRSLLPNFQLENFLVPDNAQGGAVGGAAADNPENAAGMLQALQESIRNFIQDIGTVELLDENLDQQHPGHHNDQENEDDYQEFD